MTKEKRNQGVSLPEMMVSLVILAMVAAAIVAALIQNRYLTEGNIYDNTAFNITRGYLEQMYGMDFAVLQGAADASVTNAADTDFTTSPYLANNTVNPSAIPGSETTLLGKIESVRIDTKGIDSSASTTTTTNSVDRPLYAGLWTEQTVLIDIVDPLEQKGSAKEVTTQMWFRPTITNLDDGSNNDINAVEIVLEYRFQTRERLGVVEKTGNPLRIVRSEIEFN